MLSKKDLICGKVDSPTPILGIISDFSLTTLIMADPA
jgi:hypothetical protein